MSTLRLIGHELVGMFIDDDRLARMTGLVVALAAILAFAVQAPAWLVGLLLAAGVLLVLVESVLRAARADRGGSS